MKNILLSGRPGVGKTTLVIRVIEELRSIKVGGFYTEEIRQKGIRKGFRIKTLDGQEGILAHRDIESRFRVGRYRVSMSDLEGIATFAIKKSIEKSDTIIIIRRQPRGNS